MTDLGFRLDAAMTDLGFRLDAAMTDLGFRLDAASADGPMSLPRALHALLDPRWL